MLRAEALVTRWTAVRRFARAQEGQDLLEYGLLMALIAITALGAITSLGQMINTVFWNTIANNF